MDEKIGTPQWITKNNEILSKLHLDSPLPGGDITLVIEIRSDQGDTSFSLRVGKDGPRLGPVGHIEDSPTLILDQKTAHELHEGTKSVAEAISEGSVKIKGKVESLVDAGDTLSRFAKALATILRAPKTKVDQDNAKGR